MRRLLAELVARPIGVALTLLAVVALGVLALVRLPLGAVPPISRPAVRVTAELPDMGMERMEADLARRLEARLLVLAGCDSVAVWCADTELAADVTFRWGVDPERARLAVVEALEEVGSSDGAPVRWQVDLALPQERASLLLLVSGERPLATRSTSAEEVVLPALAAVPGVARVEVLGGARQRIVVRPRPELLASHGVTAGEVRAALENASRRLRLGEVLVDGESAEVVTESVGASAAAVAALPVPLAGGSSVQLGDLASVRSEPWGDHGELLVGGTRAVGLALHLEAGANALAVNRALARVLADLGGRLPAGVRLERTADRLAELLAALQGVLVAGAIGAVVSGLILALFVRRLGPLVVLLLAIPLSLAAALAVFEALGLGLNLVSLVGMALAVGMLVDAAVVVLDACLSGHGGGSQRAVEGTARTARAVVASAVTTAVVFVPALYLRHLAAALFRELAIAVMVTLLASLVLALLAAPVAAARLAPWTHRGEGSLARGYRRVLTRLTARPWWSLPATAACLVLCALLASGMPQQLLAPEAASAVELRFVLPPQPPPIAAPPHLEQLLAPLKDAGELDVLALGLEPASGPPLPGGFWYLPRARPQDELVRLGHALQAALPGLSVRTAGPVGGVLEALPLRRLEVELWGRERSALAEATDRVTAQLRTAGVPVVAELPSARVSLEARPTARGSLLAAGELEGALSAALPAFFPPQPGSIRLDERELAAGDLAGTPVRLAATGSVPLASVAELVAVSRPAALVRHQGQAATRLVVGEATADVAAVEPRLEAVRELLPAGVELRAGGGFTDWHEARQELALAIGLGLLLVLLVLAALYESFRFALAVLAALPFALLGGLLAQRLAGQGLDLGSGLGMVLLVGVAVNNGVLLLDRLHRCPAGPAVWAQRASRRLRPVLVTTLTTLATMAPIALAGGAGASLRVTLARTALAGLALSTVACLLVLPPLARILLPRRPEGGSQ